MWIYVFLFLFFVSDIITAQKSQPQHLKEVIFNKRVFDFGEIKEENGLVSHEFEFRNGVGIPIYINGISSGCGCIKFEYSKKPVLPNEISKIKVYFNPAYRPGFFSKEIVVLYNDNVYYNRIWIKGTVIPCKHPVSDNYPYEYGEGLWMNLEVMAFGYMDKGDEKKMSLKFANDTDRDMKLFFIVIDGNTDVRFTSPYILKAGEEKVMPITYHFSGRFSREVYVYPVVNGKVLDKALKIMCTQP